MAWRTKVRLAPLVLKYTAGQETRRFDPALIVRPSLMSLERNKEPAKMNRISLTVLLAASMAATIGCSTKNYVRQETTPLINKTNELDDLTAKNSKDIKDVDARAQAGIQGVQTRAAEVDQKALAAGKQADDAQLSANNATQ